MCFCVGLSHDKRMKKRAYDVQNESYERRTNSDLRCDTEYESFCGRRRNHSLLIKHRAILARLHAIVTTDADLNIASMISPPMTAPATNPVPILPKELSEIPHLPHQSLLKAGQYDPLAK